MAEVETRVGAVFIGATDDQMTATDSHVKATRCLARLEHGLQGGNDRR
jgi:hypothetical protein